MATPNPDRERRLADALRANLRKRKERDRAPEKQTGIANPAPDPK